jgi:hypothetical protein
MFTFFLRLDSLHQPSIGFHKIQMYIQSGTYTVNIEFLCFMRQISFILQHIVFFTFGIMKDLSRTIPHEKFEQMSPDKIMRYSALFLEN